MTSNPPTHPDWYLGLDLGTSSCKCALIDTHGQLLAVVNQPYPDSESNPGWKTQGPEAVLEGLTRAVQRGTAKAGVDPARCAAASLGGALHSLVLLDREGRPLTPVSTWADDRAAAQAEAVRQSGLGRELYQATGCPPHGMYPLYKLRWLHKHQPDLLQQAGHLVSAKEYVTARLTGRYLVDYSLASGSGLLNMHTLAWEPEALEAAGIPRDQLSELSGPRTRLHVTDRDFLDATGLPAGLTLVLGSSDAANSNLGAGAVRPETATCMIGSSAAYRVLAPEPILPPEPSTWCYAVDRDHWLVGGALNSGGLAVSWLKELAASLAEGETLSFNRLLKLAEASPAGSRGLLFLPLLAGERSPGWNLQARGALVGLSLEHTLGDITRAVLEGIAFRLRLIDELLSGLVGGSGGGPKGGPGGGSGGVPKGGITRVRASGGFTRSPFWIQLISDVLGRPLEVPRCGDTSALGAAYWARIGAQGTQDLADAEEWPPVEAVYQPDPDLASRYQELDQLSRELYRAAGPFSAQLAELRDQPG